MSFALLLDSPLTLARVEEAEASGYPKLFQTYRVRIRTHREDSRTGIPIAVFFLVREGVLGCHYYSIALSP
jgi:hypothetical protein